MTQPFRKKERKNPIFQGDPIEDPLLPPPHVPLTPQAPEPPAPGPLADSTPPPPTPAFEVHAAGLGSLLQASQDVSEYGGWTESVGGFGEDSAPASFGLMGPFLAAAELRPLWASVIAALTSDGSHVGVSLIALLLPI